MRIAQVAPLYEAVPPRLYGGTERIVAHLTDALVELGHEVTLFASADARTSAKLVPVRDQAIRLDPAPAEVRPRRPPLDAARAAPAGGRVRRPPLPRRPASTSRSSRSIAAPDRDHAARPARPEGPAGVYRRWPHYPAGLDLATTSAGRCPGANWVAHGRITACATDLYRFSRGARGRLPRLPRPHLAREAARPGDRDRQARGAQRSRSRPRSTRPTAPTSSEVIEPLLADPADRVRRRDRRRREVRRSSATPRRCCSRSTGRSRSAW